MKSHLTPRSLLARAPALLCGLALAAPAAAAVDYAADIKPILETRCYDCHGEKKQKAKLRLDSPEAILKGGKGGPAVVAGDATSPLFVRVSLPPGDEDIMPPKGAPLTKAQQDAILAWIKAGAPMGDGPAKAVDGAAKPPGKAAEPAPAKPVEPPKADPTKPGSDLKPDAKPVPPDSRKDLAPIPDTDLDALAKGVAAPNHQALETLAHLGVWSRALSKNGALLELDYRPLKGPITADALKPLAALADNVVWLDFGGCGITDRDLTHLRPLKHLSSLHLERTAITDKGLADLAGLSELRYLNLYGTKVGDAGLHQLDKLANLRELYLWQTQATPEAAGELAKATPGLEVSFAEDLPDPPRAEDGGKGEKKKKGKKL